MNIQHLPGGLIVIEGVLEDIELVKVKLDKTSHGWDIYPYNYITKNNIGKCKYTTNSKKIARNIYVELINKIKNLN